MNGVAQMASATAAGIVSSIDNSMASDWIRAELEKSFGYVQLAHCFVPSFMAQWGAAICSKHADFVMLPGDLAARIDAVGRENFLVYDEVWHQACTHLPRLLERRLRE